MFVLENANHSGGLTLLNLVTMRCENWKPICISPVQDLGDTAVGDAKLSRDDARSHAGDGHLDDLEPDLVDGDDGQVCDDDVGHACDDDHASCDVHDDHACDLVGPDVVGQGPAIDEDSAQLVDPTLPWGF